MPADSIANVRACGHSNADIGLRERWRVINAVSIHRHNFTLRLQFFILFNLSSHYFRDYIVYSYLFCYRQSRIFIVSGKHYYFNAKLVKIFHRLYRFRFMASATINTPSTDSLVASTTGVFLRRFLFEVLLY